MDNILLHPSGHIKITDFGLALENAVPGVWYTKVCGTPNYMAPEVNALWIIQWYYVAITE